MRAEALTLIHSREYFKVGSRKQPHLICESTAFEPVLVKTSLLVQSQHICTVPFSRWASCSLRQSASGWKYKLVFTKRLLKHQPGARSNGWMLNSIDFRCLLMLKQFKSATVFKSLWEMIRHSRTGPLPHAFVTAAWKLVAWKWFHRYGREGEKNVYSCYNFTKPWIQGEKQRYLWKVKWKWGDCFSIRVWKHLSIRWCHLL